MLCPCGQGLFWQLAELQRKVRSEVSSEYWLYLNCASSDKQLFDWGMMTLRRPLYGVGDAFATEADDQFRKKRDAEVIPLSSSSSFLFTVTQTHAPDLPYNVTPAIWKLSIVRCIKLPTQKK